METVDFGGDGAEGIVQAAPVVTTSPYGIEVRDEPSVVVNLELDRAVSSASWGAPALDSLFGSQDEVTMLSAPTGLASLAPARPGLELSRAALASAVALVFMGGLATASLTLQPRVAASRPAPAVLPVIVQTPSPFTTKAEPAAELAAVEAEPAAEPAAAERPAEPAGEPTTIQVTAPVKIRVQKKAAAQVVVAASAAPTSSGIEAPTAKWVDPFAD